MTWLANLSVHDAGTLAVVVTVLVLVLIAAVCELVHKYVAATEDADYWQLGARIRRDERDAARALLAVAEDVNAMPCQCGCDTERWSETPVYDRLLVEELHEDIAAFEQGGAA